MPSQSIAEPSKGLGLEKTRDYVGRKRGLAAYPGDESITVNRLQRDFESTIRKRENLHGSFIRLEDGGLTMSFLTTRVPRNLGYRHNLL